MWNGYQIFGAVLIIGGAFGGLLFWYGGKIQQDKSDKEQTKEIIKSIDKSGVEIKLSQNMILKEIFSIQQKIGNIKDSKEIIQNRSEKTFEIAKNYNANFLKKEGYEEKGSLGTWFTPMWEGVNNRKFFLLDFVGELEKNRISIFFDKTNLICRILTSDGKKETLSIDTTNWIKGKPYLIFATWDTSKNLAKLYAGARGDQPAQIVEKTIPNLHFNKIGPLVFMGIDFEGKFPAKVQPGSLKISESNKLKEMGYSEYSE